MIFDMTTVTSCELIHKDANLGLYGTYTSLNQYSNLFLHLSFGLGQEWILVQELNYTVEDRYGKG